MHIEEGNALFSTFAVSPFEHKDEEKPEKARNGTHNFNPEERRRTDMLLCKRAWLSILQGYVRTTWTSFGPHGLRSDLRFAQIIEYFILL